MQAGETQKLFKVYPLLPWGIGGVGVIFWGILFLINILFFSHLRIPAGIPLIFIGLSIGIMLMGYVLEVNQHFIAVVTVFTRHQIGWDEIKTIAMSQRQAYIALIGRSTTGTPKMLVISGPNSWQSQKKQIKKIFAQQIKLRQLNVIEDNIASSSSSSQSTLVRAGSANAQKYIAAPPKNNVQDWQEETNSTDLLKPVDQRSQREIELEKKINKPGLGSLADGNLILGAAGGFAAAIFGSLIWAAIAFVTHREFSIVSIALGFLVGASTKLFAGKSSLATAFMGGGFAVLGCMLGNTLGVIMIVCEGNPALIGNVFFTFLMHPALLFAAYGETFSAVDVLFYLISVFGAFRVAMR